MSINPWQPPSGWDRIEAQTTDGSWTVRRALGLVWAAFRRQPFGVLVFVLFLPGVWAVPATIANDLLVPDDEPIFGPGRSVRAWAITFASSAWNTVWFAGQLSAAIDAVRERRIRWQAYFTGLRRAPALFLSSVLPFLPVELLAVLPVDWRGSGIIDAFDVVGALGVMYLGARTCLWAPLIVDGHTPFWEGLSRSWELTQGSLAKLVALALILSAALVPLALIEVTATERAHVVLASFAAVYTLALAAVYVLVCSAPVVASRVSVASNRDLEEQSKR